MNLRIASRFGTKGPGRPDCSRLSLFRQAIPITPDELAMVVAHPARGLPQMRNDKRPYTPRSDRPQASFSPVIPIRYSMSEKGGPTGTHYFRSGERFQIAKEEMTTLASLYANPTVKLGVCL